MRPARLLALVALASFVAWACGADNKEAPGPPPPVAPQCPGVDQLMPNFMAVINSGGTQGLAQVIQANLINPPQPNEPAPAADVLRAIVDAVASFAAYPPEPGAASGAVCAEAPTPIPPLSQANPLCELRRVLDSLIHAGNGLTALGLIDPLLSGALDYIIGKPPSSSTPHYEVSADISRMCEQSATCQATDTLDLVIGLTAYLQTPAGKQLITDSNNLVTNPALAPYITTNGNMYGGPAGVVALVNILITTIEGLQDPSQLGSSLNSVITVLPPAIQPDVENLVNDLEQLLQPNILTPLKRSLHCYDVSDTNRDLIVMIYNLVFVDQLSAFGLTSLVNTLQGLQNTDQRGSLLYLVNLFATAIRNDPTAPNSLGEVCSTLTAPANATLALPDVATLFEQGAAGELICTVDTLVYGCSGASQPACAGVP